MTLPLVPAPAIAELHDGNLVVRDGSPLVVGSAELIPVAKQFIEDVRIDTGITLALDNQAEAPVITVALDVTDLGAVAVAQGIRADGASAADERYGLRITADNVHVWAATAEGVYRALTSLRQLISARAENGTATLDAASVIDGPRYAWRGLSLDVVRAFHAPETLRRVIDMCALHKLNVLHLHLTDDQGWRIEVPSRPALTTVGSIGAYGDRPGGYYTVAEMTALSAYAAERFVTLVPEIDMPGHTGAIFHAYPELASGSADDDHIEGVSILNPESEKTWAFVEDVLDAVIPQFPQSAYLHVGGDEAFGMPDEAHAAFVERASALVRARGRLALGWQEIARAELRPDEIVQYWMDSGDSESLLNIDTLSKLVPAALLPLIAETAEKAKHDAPRALSMGTKLIISSLSRLYFDRPHAEASADPAQDELRAHVGFPIYPPLSIRDGVEWDPVDDTPGVPDDSVVAGVEAAIWCETIADRDQLELMLLPRLGGAAEKAWAPRRPTSWDDYAPRLSAQSGIWTARGWNWYQTQEVDWTKA